MTQSDVVVNKSPTIICAHEVEGMKWTRDFQQPISDELSEATLKKTNSEKRFNRLTRCKLIDGSFCTVRSGNCLRLRRSDAAAATADHVRRRSTRSRSSSFSTDDHHHVDDPPLIEVVFLQRFPVSLLRPKNKTFPLEKSHKMPLGFLLGSQFDALALDMSLIEAAIQLVSQSYLAVFCSVRAP